MGRPKKEEKDQSKVVILVEKLLKRTSVLAALNHPRR